MIRITNRMRVAIDICVHLAIEQKHDDEVLNSSQIQKRMNLKESRYVETILPRLVKARILTSWNGDGGGYALNDDKTIKVSEIIQAVKIPSTATKIHPLNTLVALVVATQTTKLLLEFNKLTLDQLVEDYIG